MNYMQAATLAANQNRRYRHKDWTGWALPCTPNAPKNAPVGGGPGGSPQRIS